MVIGVDASRAVLVSRSGTENYSYQILAALARRARQGELLAYLPSDELHSLNMQTRVITDKRFWTQFGLMRRTWQDALDVLFIPAHVIPFFKKPSLPTVVTVHDLRTEFIPQHSSWLQRLYLNSLSERLRAHLATKIIAVSESTKKDLVKKLHVSEEKIQVIYEGVDTEFFSLDKLNDNESFKNVLKKHRLEKDGYLFFVGTVQPRKNLVRLIEAFAKFAKDNPDTKLVIAGKAGWMFEKIYARPKELGIADSVEFLGYVDIEDLPFLYAGAKATVFPSLYEGFGLPILESLAMQTPILTSNVASMPEVGGDLAIYVDPYDVESIVDGLHNVVSVSLDEEKRNEHLRRFSWDETGLETYQLLVQTANLCE